MRSGEVLDVVDGEQRRAAAMTEREGAAGVVDDVDIGELPRVGEGLGEQATATSRRSSLSR